MSLIITTAIIMVALWVLLESLGLFDKLFGKVVYSLIWIFTKLLPSAHEHNFVYYPLTMDDFPTKDGGSTFFDLYPCDMPGCCSAIPWPTENFQLCSKEVQQQACAEAKQRFNLRIVC